MTIGPGQRARAQVKEVRRMSTTAVLGPGRTALVTGASRGMSNASMQKIIGARERAAARTA
jgi:hypothetical protein